MKINRNKLENILNDICMHIATDVIMCNQIYDYTKEKYNIPRGDISDLVCFRKSMSEVSEFILFCLLDSTIEIKKIKNKLSDFYTDQEIDMYEKSKYKVDKIKFPIKIKTIQIDSDQWIGKIDATFLMKLRAAQLINYNTNAQRTMQKVIKGDKEIYKISINKSAVSEITSSYKQRNFIPNTITLNMPIDSDFYYNKDSCELIINKLEHFHILDAYHRYIALCKASDEDENFNYNMELRIVNWEDLKSQTFIWQEDKKTQLKKIDSNSLNMNDAANIIVTRINENPRCNIKGLISRNDGLINFGELAELIKFFYLKKSIRKEEENLLIISLVKELTNCFNMITEYDLKYLNKKYSYKQLVIIIYMFYIYRDKDKEYMCENIDRVVCLQDQLDNKKFYYKVPRKSMLNEIDKIINEVIVDV